MESTRSTENLIPPRENEWFKLRKAKSLSLSQRSSQTKEYLSRSPGSRRLRVNSFSSIHTYGSKDSKGSRASSTFIPRRVPWALKGISQRMIPSDREESNDETKKLNLFFKSKVEEDLSIDEESIDSLSSSSHEKHENSLQMDSIFQDFKLTGTPLPLSKSLPPSSHERSKSADYAEFVKENSALLEFPDQLLVSQLKGYGAATNASNDVVGSATNGSSSSLKSYQNMRTIRRRIFLMMTDPTSSILSLIFFVILTIMICSSNIVMMLETMEKFQYIPDECEYCDNRTHMSEDSNDDDITRLRMLFRHDCQCPPRAREWIISLEDRIIFFFVVEWIMKTVCFDPGPDVEGDDRSFWRKFWDYLTDVQTIIDALATFPYYLEKCESLKGFLSMRILRLFRVFQLVRLGQYNVTFCALVNVFTKSVTHLYILCMALVFSAGIFGYLIFWFEKGEWAYTDLIDPPGYAFIRISMDGVTKELSPFKSIPDSFWWFITTATTVGYGDVYPTSFGGKCVATAAMMLGVLVVAFPVSIFSELWRDELKDIGVLKSVDGSQVSNEDNDDMGEAETLPKFIAADFNNSPFILQKAIQESIRSNNEALPKEDTLSAKDIRTIEHYMSVIDEAQQNMRLLLKNIESNSA